MTRFLFLYSLLATVIILTAGNALLRENNRLRQNQETLTDEVILYRTKHGEAAASVQELRLRCGEFEQMHAADLERIRQLGVRLRRLESVAQTTTSTNISLQAPVRDTVIISDTLLRPTLRVDAQRGVLASLERIPVRDTVAQFRWSDPWVSIRGRITRDSVECDIHSTDTLRQIVHRIPRRFLGIPYGTRALRQEIVSSNPHTTIVYSEYITIARRRLRRP